MSRRLLLTCFVLEVALAGLIAAYSLSPTKLLVLGQMIHGMVTVIPLLILSGCIILFITLLSLARKSPDQEQENLTEETRAVADLQSRAKFNPSAYNLYELASFCLKTSRYQAAVKTFRDLLFLEPDRTTAQYGLGIALFRSGSTDESISVLTRVREADPHHDYGLIEIRLAEALLRGKKSKEALFTLDQNQDCIGLAEFHFLRGQALEQLDRNKEARVELRRVLEAAATAPSHRKEKDRHLAQLAREVLLTKADQPSP